MEILIFLGLFISSALVNIFGRSILWKELQTTTEISDESKTTNLVFAALTYAIGAACVALIFFGPAWAKNIVFICMSLGIIYKSIEMFRDAGFNKVSNNIKTKVSIYWIAQAIGFSVATYYLWLATHNN